MIFSEYLKSVFDYKFSDERVSAVLARRGLDGDVELSSVSEKDIDLATADLYVLLTNIVSGGGKKVQKGNRSVSDRSYSINGYDRRNFLEIANRLYAKWGEKTSVVSSARFVHLKGD